MKRADADMLINIRDAVASAYRADDERAPA